MSLLSQGFKTNPEKESEGVWFDYGEVEPGKGVEGDADYVAAKMTRFKLARMSRANKKYQKSLEKATRPHRRQIDLETLPESQAENLFMGVFVDTVLLAWENVAMDDVTGDEKHAGTYAPFNRAHAISLFKRLPELYEDLQDKAKKAAAFRDEQREAEAGN